LGTLYQTAHTRRPKELFDFWLRKETKVEVKWEDGEWYEAVVARDERNCEVKIFWLNDRGECEGSETITDLSRIRRPRS
jgi:hypothetical protein